MSIKQDKLFKLKINICTIPITLLLLDKDTYDQAMKRYARYLTKRNGYFTIKVNLQDNYLSSDMITEPTVNKYNDYIEIRRFDIYAKLDVTKKQGRVLLFRQLASLDTFFRILASVLLLEKDGFIIHSAGSKFGKSGYLFPGQSGAGKTTFAKMFDKRKILSDELICVKRKGSRFEIIATPFMGGFEVGNSAESVPLKSIFFLKKNKDVYCRKIAKDLALIKMLNVTMFFLDGGKENKKLLTIARDIVETIPAFELCYDKNIVDSQTIQSIIVNHSCWKY